MSTPIQIDFVSDVSCPWCAIGLYSLEQALARLGGAVSASIRFRAFELNPQMPPEGQDIGEHIAQKYGASEAQMAQTRAAIRARGAEVGFVFNSDRRGRIYNTFTAHRLLHWAAQEGGEGAQAALKKALFAAYFTAGEDVSARSVLLASAVACGLDAGRAAAVLDSDACAEAVRAEEAQVQAQGISAVPAVIINNTWLVQGGQPPEVFERALRQIVADHAA